MPTEPFDLVVFCVEYEAGELDEEQIIDGFQHLVNSGQVWRLQGSYGRMATRLIDQGLVMQPEFGYGEDK